ncbi:MAG: 6-bladed beta-propeller [Bacillota bacterium]
MKIKVTTLIISILALALGGTVVYGAFYLRNQNPVQALTENIPIAAVQTGPPEFKFAIYGRDQSPLKYPMDVTENGGNIYVSDTDNSRVEVFDYNGKFVRSIGKKGNSAGELQTPYGLAFGQGKLYVADLDRADISMFEPNGKFVGYFENKGKKPYYKPADLVIKDNKLYVADVINMQVYVIDLNGNLLLEIGEEGTGKGQFKYPNGVAVDKDNNIYVADSGNNRVQVFDPQGKYLRTLGGKEGQMGSLTTDRGIVVDKKDRLWVVTGLLGQVKVLNKDTGEEIFQLGSQGTDNGQFNLPNGLYIDGNSRVYISEVGNDRVSVFK